MKKIDKINQCGIFILFIAAAITAYFIFFTDLENFRSEKIKTIENYACRNGEYFTNKIIPDGKYAHICGEYYTDGKSIYVDERNRGHLDMKKIYVADLETFEPLNISHAKDKDHAYYSDKTIKDSDPKTFESLDEYYSKDKDNVYYMSAKIDNADPKTFKLLDEPYLYAKDKNHKYQAGRIVE